MKLKTLRWLCLVLCLCLTVGAIAGCGNSDNPNDGSSASASGVESETEDFGSGDNTATSNEGSASNVSNNSSTISGQSGSTTSSKKNESTTSSKQNGSYGKVAAKEFPYKVIYNSDVTNVIYCISPYNNARGSSVTATKLDASVKEAADGGADAFSFTPGLCWVPWWPSEAFPAIDYIKWFTNVFSAKYGSAISSDPHYSYAFKHSRKGWGYLAHDIIKEQIDSCRKYNMAAILSYRMNDSHYSNLNNTTFTPKIGYTSQIQVDHPEWKQSEGSEFERTLFDYRFSEYREYRLTMIKELIANYDLDGFEMDFMRWHDIFTTSKTTDLQRLEIMVGFIKEIRAALDTAASNDGKYRYLIAKIPAWSDTYGDMGIDIKAWASAGVDVFNLSVSTITAQDAEIKYVKKAVPSGKKVFYELTCASNYISNNANANYISMGSSIVRRTTVEQLYTTAYLAYAQGADGISLFNYQYYRGIPESANDDRDNKGFVNEPPFSAIGNLGNKTFLAKQAQNYCIGREDHRTYRRNWQMPASLGKNASASFTLPMKKPEGGWTTDGVLRLWSEADMGNATYKVTVNGIEVKLMSVDPGEPYKSAYTTGLGTSSQRRCYTVPKDILKSDADNVINVTQTDGSFTFISYLDLAIK